MQSDRLARFAPLAGLQAVVLLVAGVALMGTSDYFPGADRAREIFETNVSMMYAGTLLAGFVAPFFLLVFVGSLFGELRQAEGVTGGFAATSFAGGIVAVMALAIGAGFLRVAIARAGRPGGISPDEALVIYDLYTPLAAGVLSVGLAALVGAAGLAGLRTSVFPRWLGWTSVAIAIGLLTPIHYLFEVAAVLWIGGASVLLYRRGTRRLPAPAS